jgi:hypothetical protein
MIRPLGKDVAIDVLGTSGYAVVPASHGYSFVKGTLEEVPNLPTLNSDILKPALIPVAMVPARLVERLPQMAEGSGRNNTLFKAAVSLASGATSKESLLEEVKGVNSLFAEPLPFREVEGVSNSAWDYREKGTLLVKGKPSFLIPKDAHDRLKGNCEAIALFSDLLRNHSMRKRDEFVLANKTRERLAERDLAPFGWPDFSRFNQKMFRRPMLIHSISGKYQRRVIW